MSVFGIEIYYFIFPLLMFLYLFYLKKMKLTQCIKHVSIYIVLMFPFIFIDMVMHGLAMGYRSFSTETFLSISFGLLGLIYLMILNRFKWNKKQSK